MPLLNVDFNIYNLLYNSLVSLLSDLIDLYQVGFIPTWEAKGNSARLQNVIHSATSCKIAPVLMSTGIEIFSSSVNQAFLNAVGVFTTLH